MPKAGNRKLALIKGASKYFGKLCKDHLELNGLRYTQGSNCVKCQRHRSLEELQVTKIRRKVTRQAIKVKVFKHYGGKCLKCGATDLDILTIDHTNQNGALHRKSLGSLGLKIYIWLLKNKFPKGFRVLCFNCNIKAFRVYKRKQEVLYALK
jgi:predicted nucleic-acid-binding Zn-ribbon protein